MSAHEHHSSIYPDDETLVQAAADGDRTACRLVAMRLYARVRVMVESLGVPFDDFEGAVDRSLCEILQCIGEYSGPDTLEAWGDHLVQTLIDGPGRRRPWSKRPPKINVDELLLNNPSPVDELHCRRQVMNAMSAARSAIARQPKPKPIPIVVATVIALLGSAALVAVTAVNQTGKKPDTNRVDDQVGSQVSKTIADNDDDATTCDCNCPENDEQLLPGESFE